MPPVPLLSLLQTKGWISITDFHGGTTPLIY
nr:MAG TPA: hypothetical protein [Bacteriophage sp.]